MKAWLVACDAQTQFREGPFHGVINHMDNNNTKRTVRKDIGCDERPSYVIIQAMAELNNVNVLALDPLYQYVDLEALDQLIEHFRYNDHNCRVEVTADDCQITIHDDSSVVVQKDTDLKQ